MPNRKTHAAVGMALGGTLAAARVAHVGWAKSLPEIVGGVAGGFVGGILPDLLEPATSPRHRKVAHSLIAAAGLTLVRIAEGQAACRSNAEGLEQQGVGVPVGSCERNDAELGSILWRLLAGAILGFVVGYASHLALDAGTPCGLPIIGDLD
jgi:membrane-bound metal-dependent hydrolase YbcI (DUF457 family)